MTQLFGSFICTRTLAWDDKPCPEAYEVDFVEVERRRTPATNWYKYGRNHREELGMLVRETDDKRWMVDIPDGAALQAFIEEHGTIIISLNTEGLRPCYEIEIYDGYRE